MSNKRSLKVGFRALPFKLTEKQEDFLSIMTDKETRIVFLSGKAGSSKSFLATYASLQLFNKDARKKIMYLRSAVESSDRSLGLLKGDLETKCAPYMSVFIDKIEEMLDKTSSSALASSDIVSLEVVNFLRGKTFIDTTVLADEAQNFSLKELITIVSRIGIGSKIFVVGDPTQSDIKNSGFVSFFNAFNNEEARNKGIYCLEFGEEDIVRDGIIKYIYNVYENQIIT